MFVVMCYSSPREQIQPALHSPAQDIARTPLTTLQAAIGQARPHRMHALDGPLTTCGAYLLLSSETRLPGGGHSG